MVSNSFCDCQVSMFGRVRWDAKCTLGILWLGRTIRQSNFGGGWYSLAATAAVAVSTHHQPFLDSSFFTLCQEMSENDKKILYMQFQFHALTMRSHAAHVYNRPYYITCWLNNTKLTILAKMKVKVMLFSCVPSQLVWPTCLSRSLWTLYRPLL